MEDMTNWRAVGIGFLIELVLSIVLVVVPGLGQLAAALIGGFAAGYVAGGGLTSGFWHGLLAGALGGILVAVIIGLFGSAVLGLGGGGAGVAFGLGVTLFAIAVFFLISIPSAVAGIVGSAVS
jgi:hypothetical protein